MQPPAIVSRTQSAHSTPILESRSQYRACHILVPDADTRLPAILVAGQYYSFFRTEKDEKHALKVCDRLRVRGDATIITKIPKGYGVWVLEAEAKLVDPIPRRLSASGQTSVEPSRPATPTPYKILSSRSQYHPCHIRVPDLDKRLAAICVDGKYYSLFKAVEDIQQAVQIIRRLSYRGDETVVTKTVKGYGLWILEPDAYPDVAS